MDWYEVIHYKVKRSPVFDHDHNSKTKQKLTSTKTNYNSYNLPHSYFNEGLYLNFIKAIGMYECVKYTRMVQALMVCYVTEMRWPDMSVIMNKRFTVSHWAPLRENERRQVFIKSKYNKLRYIIKHQQNFPIYMFVYDAEEERFRDEEEHYAHILREEEEYYAHMLREEEEYNAFTPNVTKRRRSESPPKAVCAKQPKMVDAFTSKRTKTVGTQTCMLECHGILNKPMNVTKSLINREIYGTINQTSTIMSLPICALTKEQNILKRLSPQDNMKAITRMYHKMDNEDELDLYDTYNRCTRCFHMFAHECIVDLCCNCNQDLEFLL